MNYAFWNNKGGTGKTSLAFQTICEYSLQNLDKRILVIDLCPQANLSELFMGGLLKNGGRNLNNLYNANGISRSIGGYFQERLVSPFLIPQVDFGQFLTTPNLSNRIIPTNIDLVAGDRVVELQSNFISSLAITPSLTIDSYTTIVNWVNELLN